MQMINDTVVQIWKSDVSYVDRVTSAGYKAIFSSCWYLDSNTYGVDWTKFYMCKDGGYSGKTTSVSHKHFAKDNVRVSQGLLRVVCFNSKGQIRGLKK